VMALVKQRLERGTLELDEIGGRLPCCRGISQVRNNLPELRS